MKKTAEERAEISRANGRKSRGPTSPEGGAAASRIALRHGMRAKTLTMAHEDSAMIAERTASWNDHYRPNSPAAQHLVNLCVAATLQSDRCQLAHDSALADQVEEAAGAWEQSRWDEVAEAWKGLVQDPGETVASLERSGHG